LSQGRIQCKTKLVKKGIVENALCDGHAAEETPAHVIFGCASGKEFWMPFKFKPASIGRFRDCKALIHQYMSLANTSGLSY
jgi:hypothetical protein